MTTDSDKTMHLPWLLSTANKKKINKKRGDHVQKNCEKLVHVKRLMHEKANIPITNTKSIDVIRKV